MTFVKEIKKARNCLPLFVFEVPFYMEGQLISFRDRIVVKANEMCTCLLGVSESLNYQTRWNEFVCHPSFEKEMLSYEFYNKDTKQLGSRFNVIFSEHMKENEIIISRMLEGNKAISGVLKILNYSSLGPKTIKYKILEKEWSDGRVTYTPQDSTCLKDEPMWGAERYYYSKEEAMKIINRMRESIPVEINRIIHEVV